jgi:hypothetical protein
MSTFGAYNKKTNNPNSTLNNNIFKETISYIDKQWDKWNNEISKLEQDCDNLQRMYNEYNRDTKYLELRQDIINIIEFKKSQLLELEKTILNIKMQIASLNK